MLGGLECHVRRVEEVTRGVTSRDEYEKVARDIRYAFYRQCRAEALSGSSGGVSGGVSEQSSVSTSATTSATVPATTSLSEVVLSGVIFGHHLGDVQENVISNVMRYCFFS